MRQGGEAGEAVYIATAQAFDEEMRRRIDKHRAQREQTGFAWRTLEEPLRLADLLRELDGAGSPAVLVDCLTLWLSNLLLELDQRYGLNTECELAAERQME